LPDVPLTLNNVQLIRSLLSVYARAVAVTKTIIPAIRRSMVIASLSTMVSTCWYPPLPRFDKCVGYASVDAVVEI
jgi:hypothetical protein